MSDPKPEDFKKERELVHPLDGLPSWLKEPEAYEKVQRALYDAQVGSCGTHAEVLEWAGCTKCQQAQWNVKEMMARFGFKDGAQYLAWRKTHEYIKEHVPFAKYNSL